ncbi:ankyrin repeat-containing domain protein [Trichoderma chlorosporum]
MHVCSPSLWISSIDIVDRTASIGHSENHAEGALVSIDLTCPPDLFKGLRRFIAKLGLSFTAQIQDGFRKSIEIQNAEVGYYRVDNNIAKMVDNLPNPPLQITGAFKEGKADIEIPQPDDKKKDNLSNIRIIVILDAYPSNMELSASLSTRIQSSTGGNGRPSHASPSTVLSQTARPPDEERLQRLLCWAAGLGYEKLFAAYLDQEPSILDMEDEFGMTPFSWAAFAGQASIIQRAFQQGNFLNARERTVRGLSPLEVAASNNESMIFELFLKYLKYVMEFDGEIPEHSKLHLFKLDDKDVEKELKIAVAKEQPAIIERLVKMLLDRQDRNKEEAWLARKMIQAAKEGALCLVQVLKDCGAEVHTEIEDGNEQKTTPLMAAITHNQIAVAEFLISHDAGDENALRTAVQRGQHKTIRALLQAGIQVTGNFKQEVHKTATVNRDSTTLMLLKLEKGTGKLATSKNLYPDVDNLFESTVVEFVEDEGPAFRELTVNKLMEKPGKFFSVTGKTKFKWFHLPANNVRNTFLQIY